ncbi:MULTISPECIES: uroporphyrinogen-III C-methyltransferase [Dehalobacter]|jgi:uroporphyrinogen III methyltransferase/synthase|uniref:uroporphyrinogen-III C-methyltransferase n=2 Tax=Dehalobacter restrictus TaxID=55583 RepID=A0A857DLD4_9FIRM|nr:MULTISPECIES: uroporphyrinogen-III C-methyltransferase [Dehalobacter]AHF11129.1 uroporphyrinogen-III synthase [Dehalobacter restrictus DSM 9455]MCG1024611.1 uroporphyrinogen-III C-methyltransferase [Dehalobacter sp.]OCZ53989.1 uroporphyrinogen-III C-methyltransferase [Dehalobacter sp. TeCB1]QHA01777.1 uroporphyrinogen-III C-methyltransferase [Dehalobacter restrictus]
MEQKRTGKVWLVGAGPSDAGLLTVKGLRVLQNAEVVIYDKLVGIEILNLIPKDAKKIDVGKLPTYHRIPQDEINRILLEEALEGRTVVRLKGGDPFMFGRGGEELELLHEHQVPFEVVPGVTSAIAVPAYAGIPVTHRDFCSSLHIITGHTKEGETPNIDFQAAVNMKGTLVFLMGVSAIESISEGLLDAGMASDMPAAVIERGTTARQRKLLTTVGNLPGDAAKAEIRNPSVIVIGQVCSLSENFEWAGERPLAGKRVVVTRPEKLNSVLSQKVRDLGGEALEFPCIQTRPISDNKAFNAALERIKEYNWLVFSSAAGVEVLFDRMLETGRDIRDLYGIKIAVIGAGTAKVFTQRGIRIEYMPESYNVASLASGLVNVLAPGEKVLVLRAREGSEDLNRIFDQAAICYEDIPVYDTFYESDSNIFAKEAILSYDFDYAAFTSASTVGGFVNALPQLNFEKVTAVCIGEETAKAARSHGMKCVVAEKATLDSMIEAIAQE